MRCTSLALAICAVSICLASTALAQRTDGPQPRLLTGTAAFGDWRADSPAVRRKITVDALPKPFATRSATNAVRVSARPAGAAPQVPAGFHAELLASGLQDPRALVPAPNGDIFVAESGPGRIRVLRAAKGEPRENSVVFATGLEGPFGIAFYPPGPDPKWVYVANTSSVVRFAYHSGDLKARTRPEVIVRALAGAGGGAVQRGHTTRDLAFSPDGRQMFVSVGSATNVGEGMGRRSAADIARWESEHGLGAAWGNETERAAVLVFDPDGKSGRLFATGLRNCVGLAVHPQTGALWCSVNERDELGDDLVPDFITRVRDGSFFGWPWYYLGAHEDPRRRGERPDLKDKITVPDVLVQAHSASMRIAFYQADRFPAQYRGDAFAALHGSWNRSRRTGYKVIRVRMRDGLPTGEYEDFMTGFVVNNSTVWGRPVGVAVARDGALLVTEDGNGTIWRVTYRGE
ncbi:MAG: sorbosone dehydrogenase family protein [Bradyrhizobium sp.]|nr:sorbosone dehydrogenase family protein [Bradyrhizobium sp.]